MKTLKSDLNLIDNLSVEAKSDLEIQSKELESLAGARIRIDSVEKEIVKLSVSNINGKRTSKYDLLDYTYQLYAGKLPEKYRLIITV